jgi:hypothetical protein
MPTLIELQKRYGADGLRVIAVSMDEPGDADALAAFADEHALNFPVVLSSKTLEEAYQVTAIPVSFVIDRENRLVQKLVDAQKPPAFERYLLPALYSDLTLHVSRNGVRIRLDWPVTQSSFALESAEDLRSGVWEAIPEVAEVGDFGCVLELPMTAGRRFFRLRKL